MGHVGATAGIVGCIPVLGSLGMGTCSGARAIMYREVPHQFEEASPPRSGGLAG